MFASTGERYAPLLVLLEALETLLQPGFDLQIEAYHTPAHIYIQKPHAFVSQPIN